MRTGYILQPRDREIIKHVEEYGFITISQACTIYWNDKKYAYDLARKRLDVIENLNYLKSYKSDEPYSEKIFYIEKKYMNPSKHLILEMNLYAELINIGCNIRYFKREKEWLDGDRRSDVYTLFTFNGYLYSMCAEVVINSHKIHSFKDYQDDLIDKYNSIFNSGEINKLIQEVIKKDINLGTSVLLIDDIDHVNKWDLENIPSHQVDFSLKHLSKILVV